MINVRWSQTLLALVMVFVLASCSSNKKYAYNSPSKRSVKNSKRITKKRKTTKIASISKSGLRNSIVSTAKRYIGTPYKYGGKRPNQGFDCSGFTTHVFEKNGVDISGPSYAQAKKGKRKSINELQVGDLVFFGKKNKVSHVGIVANVDNRQINVIHSTSSRGVVVDNITNSDYWQKRYLFGRDVIR